MVEKCTVNKMADRFGELNENEIQVLLINGVSKTTGYKGYCRSKNRLCKQPLVIYANSSNGQIYV